MSMSMYFGVQGYPISNGRDFALPTARDRFLSLRGPPGRVPAMAHVLQTPDRVMLHADTTVLIHHTAVRGSEGVAHARVSSACRHTKRQNLSAI